MSQSTFKSVVLAQRPKALIVPGETFTVKENAILTEKDLKDGEVLIETLYLSLDPAMRGWLNNARSYLPPVQIGEVMRGESIGRIVASKASSHPVGSFTTSLSGWTELKIAPAKEVKILDVPSNGKVTDALGVLGSTGLTAYFGITEVAQVKAGDFVVVSGAAGATGSVVVQIAKLKGAKVLGLAGSDDKVAWLKDLGADNALNYKSSTFVADFKAATKDLIDVFFDNVGGEILELAISRAKPHARYVLCGAISQYNEAKPVGPRNISMVIAMRIKLQGFIVFDYAKQYKEARKQLAQWLEEGKLQRKETIIKGGITAAEHALVDLYNGINTGKLMVEVKPVDGALKARL
ncbi:NADP-dependent leukotriene b4 12-hydroxydehydrogenase [Phlyctema vagabunda]|uniref:NADP-dependent leukotriene b4 12-hydroxydehydrogenase n=1 Tax=Phlyctema vagabunda TaxID=108571 RepID=A0ABR4PS70_9HELO